MSALNFALVDCNSFYSSCERVFNPSLKNKPVIVLSNNDGCAISMSAEAKAFGVTLGEPFYKFRDKAVEKGAGILSSNYSLYGDMSARVMEILQEYPGDVEIYSIDEAFILFRNIDSAEVTEMCRDMKNRILKYTGLPVSVGTGATRTIAKLASYYAKKRDGFDGVAGFGELDFSSLKEYYNITDVQNVWGIGRKNSARLKENGVENVADLVDLDNSLVRKFMGGVTGLRTVEELRGLSCIGSMDLSSDKQGILSSRSFGRKTGNIKDLEESVSTYIGRAALKLREQNSVAGVVGVYLTTGSHTKQGAGVYSRWLTAELKTPTSFTPDLVRKAEELVRKLYKPGYIYKKTGVMLLDIMPAGVRQKSLFGDTEVSRDKNMALIEAADLINRKWKNTLLFPASDGIKKSWRMKREMLSPRYTTSWKGILRINI